MLFAYFFFVSTVRSTEAAKFSDDRFRIVLCLSTMVVILLWMLVNAYMRCRWAGWVGGLMFLCASFVLAGVSLEYSSLYGAHKILRGNGGFLDVCASVKDALDLAQNDSSGIVTSVDVKCAPEGCMRIATDIYSFRKLRENGFTYVDKTAMLLPLADLSIGSQFFLARPRRFGAHDRRRP